MPKTWWEEPLDQIGHFVIGFVARFLFADYYWWRREAVRQWPPGKPVNVMHGREVEGWRKAWSPEYQVESEGVTWGEEYFPADRVKDMMTDMRWYVIGGQCADVVRAGSIIWWVLVKS